MASPFELFIPTNVSFQDYLAIVQTARAWADGYDLKSYSHLMETLAPQVVIDYTDVNPAWGRKAYENEAFVNLWLSEEHLGNPAMNTQHLLGMPYIEYAGAARNEETSSTQSHAVEEIQVKWSILASHARSPDGEAAVIVETSDHRAFMTHVFRKLTEEVLGQGKVTRWRIASIKPSPIYMEGDFGRLRRPAGAP